MTKELINLRPADDCDAMMPATPPPFLHLSSGWEPFAMLGGCLLAVNGLSVAFVPDGKPAPAATLPAVPLCAALACGTLVVMTAARACTFAVDPESHALTPIERWETSPAKLRTVAASPIKAEIPAPTITTPAAAAAGAVRDIDAAARAEGLLWQPVLAWVSAATSDGQPIRASEPRLITAPDGRQFDGFISLQSDDGSATLPCELEIPAWRLVVDVDPKFLESHPGADFRLMISPMLYRFDPSRKASVKTARRADSRSVCTVALAPTALATGPRPGSGDISHIAALIAGYDSLCLPATASTIDNDIAAVRAALRRKASPATYAGAMLAAPHSFTAAHAASSARAILWAGLTVTRAMPDGAEHFAATTVQAAWHAAVKVEFADGSSLVTVSEGTSDAPALFGPVMSYPAPDAVRIYITVKTAGQTTRSGSFALAPDPSRRRAVYIHQTLAPFALPDEEPSFTVPAQAPASVEMPGMLAAAPTSAPLSLPAHTPLASGKINAVAEAAFGQSAWDFGRSRFYAFTSSGIHLINIDLTRRAISSSLLDHRIVESVHALAAAEDGLAAIASGDVILISGTKIRPIAEIADAAALAWNNDDHELWVLTPACTEVLCFSGDTPRYSMSPTFAPQKTVSPCLVDRDGLCRKAAHADSPQTIDVTWTVENRFANTVCGPCSLFADIAGRFSRLSISVTRSRLNTSAPALDFTLNIKGPVKSPIKRNFIIAPCRSAIITVSASTNSASRLKAPILL